MPEQPVPDGAGSCAKRGRFWEVTDAAGQLVCLAVHKKGAREVLRRLGITEATATATKKLPAQQKAQTRHTGEAR